jgi:hypothetical protein
MSFNLLRTESSVSPRADSTGSIVVEFVDSKPQQQTATGKKKSRREEVVVEIDFASTRSVPQQAPEPVAATALANRHTEPLKTTVDDRALEIARSFYGSPQAANIRSITTRKELAELFRSIVGESAVSFAMVLFAMAKGMRVVNVYASGEKLEWRNVAPSSSSATATGSNFTQSSTQKKPDATVASTATKSSSSTNAITKKVANVTTDKEGWSTVVKGTAKPKDTAVAIEPEKPTVAATEPIVAEPVVVAQQDEDDEMMPKIIEDLQATKASIRKLEAEIAILVDEHSSIQEQIKCCPIERVVEFHRATIAELEHLLDGMEAERVALIQRKNELCDKLKN